MNTESAEGIAFCFFTLVLGFPALSCLFIKVDFAVEYSRILFLFFFFVIIHLF